MAIPAESGPAPNIEHDDQGAADQAAPFLYVFGIGGVETYRNTLLGDEEVPAASIGFLENLGEDKAFDLQWQVSQAVEQNGYEMARRNYIYLYGMHQKVFDHIFAYLKPGAT